MKNKIVVIVIFASLLSAFGALSYGTISKVEPIRSIKASLDAVIKSRLVDIDPPGVIPSPCTLYILGGSEPSLRLKFKVAAALYKRGRCNRILVLHVIGNTEFCPATDRNLTCDEWAVRELGKLGVPRAAVEPIEVREGFFGTLSEAKGVAHYVRENSISCITLITAPYHTRRAKITFQRFLEGSRVTVYALSSAEKHYLRADLVEWAKLAIYENILLRVIK